MSAKRLTVEAEAGGLATVSGNYPGIELYMSEGDRLADLVREGIEPLVKGPNL